MRTTARFALILLAGLTALSPVICAESGPTGLQRADRALFDAANRERATRRLQVLRWDEALARAAREHALLMARMGAISHQFAGELGLSNRLAQAGTRFTVAAENVGTAGSPQDLHDAWMKSPPHRANLLDPKVDAVGIASVERNGLIYAVQDFARLVPTLSLEEQERQVGALLAARGLRLLETTADVRRTCAVDRGVASGVHARYLFRYVTADIAELPEELVTVLRKGSYQSAAVGACLAEGEGPFTAYRLAIVLF
jgi:cysteine-rich secretory family protein